MKPQTADPAVLAARCEYRSATGRRCRLSVTDARSGLCRQHRAQQLQEQSSDHHLELVRNFEGFQTAQGINISLKHLYELLAQNRISPRRASVLAYINSLLLRSLPQIDADRAAGIIDPTKPKSKPVSIPVPHSVVDSAADPELKPTLVPDFPSPATCVPGLDPHIAPAPVTHTDSHAELATDLNLDADADTDEAAAPDPVYKSYWDTLVPAPDPRKKPS